MEKKRNDKMATEILYIVMKKGENASKLIRIYDINKMTNKEASHDCVYAFNDDGSIAM